MNKTGELNRVRIEAYEKTKDGMKYLEGKDFIVQANPDTFSLRHSAQYNTKNQPGGTGFYDPKWEKNLPRSLTLEFLFDGTGAIERYQNDKSTPTPKDVGNMLQAFEELAYKIKSKTHGPNYLVIRWGSTLKFPCRLKDMNVTYKMFSSQGRPLRAIVSATFQEVIHEKLAQKIINKQSADITHKRTVKAGDKLPQMSKEIYGDQNYYTAVAKENKLIQFRNMPPGQEVYFPPISKEQLTTDLYE